MALKGRCPVATGTRDQAAMSSHHIPPAWSERGYVPPEQLEAKDIEDQRGEAAYMRCFHESSKIGRVPNAAFFVNSPTARAYIEKRDKELFPVKEVSTEMVPNPDMPAWPIRKDGPKSQPGIMSSNNALPPHPLQPLNILSLPELQQQPHQFPSVAPGSIDQPHIPWSIEPRTGATGPPRMLR